MERNTKTLFVELNKGDRFYFANDKKKVVYEVTGTKVWLRSSYNRINAWGYKMLPHDLNATDEREVIFLRYAEPHPNPSPKGEGHAL